MGPAEASSAVVCRSLSDPVVRKSALLVSISCVQNPMLRDASSAAAPWVVSPESGVNPSS